MKSLDEPADDYSIDGEEIPTPQVPFFVSVVLLNMVMLNVVMLGGVAGLDYKTKLVS
jgi:hypothetical protein